MNTEPTGSKWENQKTDKVTETAGAVPEVIPFVSPEMAAKVFSSQRSLTWKEKTEQIDRSLGRLQHSKS